MNPLESLQIEGVRQIQEEREAAEDAVGQTDFLQMLVAQLENQDPLNPQDSADFAAQLAQFSSVEQLVGVKSGIDELIALGKGSEITPDRLDPTNLVGKDVVVFGSQIEIDSSRSEVSMPFRTIETAASANVTIRDARGQIVYESRLNPVSDESGAYVPLPPGDHVFTLDPEAENLEPGVYAIEFEGVSAGSQNVTVLPMVEGRVTGAVLVGNPGIRIGETVFPVSDVLEVKEPSAGGGQG